MTDTSVQATGSVSKLVATLITFYKQGDPSEGYEYTHKELCRFYHPHPSHDPLDRGIYDVNKDLEFQIQLGSNLQPEYPCKSITEAFYSIIYEKRLIFLCSISLQGRFILSSIATVSLYLGLVWKKCRIVVILD